MTNFYLWSMKWSRGNKVKDFDLKKEGALPKIYPIFKILTL